MHLRKKSILDLCRVDFLFVRRGVTNHEWYREMRVQTISSQSSVEIGSVPTEPVTNEGNGAGNKF
jgi:hypothetical protein